MQGSASAIPAFTTTPTLTGTNFTGIPNSALVGSGALTVNGTSISLGGTATVTAAAGTLTGTTLNATVVSSSLTSVGTIATGVWNGTAIANANLANSQVTIGSTAVSLGATATTIAGLTSVTSTGFTGALTGAASSNVLKAGDTMTGLLVLSADPSAALGAATKQYVDKVAPGPATAINATSQTTGTFYVVGVAATGSNQTPSCATGASITNTISFNAADGTVNAVIFNTTSDKTQKMNVADIVNASDTINKLQGVEFDWVNNGNKSSGVIAQQLELVLPHLVNTDANGLKSVNYAGITGYLIEAIKELRSELELFKGK